MGHLHIKTSHGYKLRTALISALLVLNLEHVINRTSIEYVLAVAAP